MGDQPASAKQQLNVRIPADLARRVKYRAVNNDQSMSAVVEAAIGHYLSPQNRPAD